MEQIKNELITFCTKGAAWFFLVILGLMGKFSYDIYTGRKITLSHALASTGLAFFVGYITFILCQRHGLQEDCKWIVPIATLLCDKVVLAAVSVDWKKIGADMAQYWADKMKQ